MHLIKLNYGNHLKGANTIISCNLKKLSKISQQFTDFSMLHLIPLFLNNAQYPNAG